MNGIRPLREYDKFLRIYTAVLHGAIRGNWQYWTDIHPRTEAQYQQQMFLRGVSPWYDTWMVNRSADERNRNLRGMYGIGFSDVTYPHLSGVMSENTTMTYGSASWQFSKNLARLYK